MLKKFVEDKIEVYSTWPKPTNPKTIERIKTLLAMISQEPREARIPTFAADNSCSARGVELVGLRMEDVNRRRWSRSVWEGADVENVAHADSDVYCLLHMQMGRGRRHRYVVSNGDVWCDVRGEVKGRHYRNRQWCRQRGPWKLIESPKARPLNKTAQAVIQEALKAFYAVTFKAKFGE